MSSIDKPAAPWLIELYTAQSSTPIKLRIEDRITVGRVVQGDVSKRPDVDLNSYDAESLGVSRQHSAIMPEGERLSVLDLQSNNGTFLNGVRLKPNEPHRLVNHDQLILGKLRLDVSITISPVHGGDIHKQPSLQLQDQMQSGKGQLVLVVHNDPDIAGILAGVIEKAGYATKISHEVVGAIRSYNQRRPAAVVVDMNLPDMSGLEFCRYVRRDVLQNAMPVIITHTNDKPLDAAEVMQAGADILLNKPISARELRHVVSSLITQHESGKSGMYTKHLVGTAPLTAVPPETRKNAAVLFVAGYSESPIVLTVQSAVSFGRAAGTGSLKSHIDLTRYEAANAGVSRMHMQLHFKDGKFFVEDCDSVNGTFIDGEPLKPRVLTQVRNASEVRLGQMRMYIYFLDDPLDQGGKLPGE